MIAGFVDALERRILVELFGERFRLDDVPQTLGGALALLVNETDAERVRQRQGEVKALLNTIAIIHDERRKY